MLSKEAIDDLKNDYSFEEIQKINSSLWKIKLWKVIPKQQVRKFIDNELFSKYWVNV